MRRAACVSAVTGLLFLLTGACNTIVGFGDLTKQPAPPSTDEPDPDEPKRDAGPQSGGGGIDATVPVTEDAGDASIPVASTSCPGTAPDSTPPWVSPSSRPKPCTNSDLQSFVATEARSYEEQKSSMMARNAACASCVFTEENETWGPIVHLSDGRMFHAFAICYRLAGASEACAEAAHALEWCSQKVCNICTSGLTLKDCQARARSNECAQQTSATVDACQNFGTIVNTTCGGSGNVFAVICGGL